MTAPIIIIGTGMAGYGLAREFRKYDVDTPLILVTEDEGYAYSKPMLSTGYTKNADAKALMQADAGAMARQLDAKVWTMTKVKAVNTDSQTIQLEGIEADILYSKLVLALGSKPIRPKIGGNANDQILSVNNLFDYANYRQTIERLKVRKICIIGAGLIGCEFANDLINAGYKVEIVDPMAYCLPALLPEPAGNALRNAFEKEGVSFNFGKFVTEVHSSDEGGYKVILNTGDQISADLVISAVGVKPETALASAAGIKIGKGILTDRFLETSAKHVYALGDCAEVDGHWLVYVAPLLACSRVLAKTLANNPTEVGYGAMPITIKTPVCPVVVNPVNDPEDGTWSVQGKGNNVYAEFRNQQGDLLGFALTGDCVKQKMFLQKELPSLID